MHRVDTPCLMKSNQQPHSHATAGGLRHHRSNVDAHEVRLAAQIWSGKQSNRQRQVRIIRSRRSSRNHDLATVVTKPHKGTFSAVWPTRDLAPWYKMQSAPSVGGSSAEVVSSPKGVSVPSSTSLHLLAQQPSVSH